MSTWKIDPSHSEIQFKIKHLMISTVTGEFTDFDSTLECASEGEDFNGGKVNFTAKIDSINTKNEQRDGHLKSADFFDAEKYPEISFTSSSLDLSGGEVVLKGDLTIKGTTKPITLTGDFGGVVVDGYGQTKAGFEVAGKLNRQDYGLTWSAVTEAGGVVVSDDVKLLLNVQFVKQA
ncbi:YceI family protein [Leadbetterella byssophila DSM 17132]|jgi:polyisoprenoid-binding protein YceI|uniref:YceI family protein n=1 Tax=Leadbetterella byssophila (strain DSM 17132 / JCM 16389 / KACC 11308 / NBRC 106382 / 4M15) TaxID=649349 RepID=E4RUG2_LEAB4|nr:YceI family protein [Leadbetterella byssophila]ADQ17853.1 YceI family protein [Leadbetterella byssophila DSM 17132]